MLGFYNVSVILTYLSLVFASLGIAFSLQGGERSVFGALICLMFSGLCDMFDGAVAQSYVVEVGDVYTRDDSAYRVAGGPNTVRLLGGDGGWIEITKGRLDECFESADKLL